MSRNGNGASKGHTPIDPEEVVRELVKVLLMFSGHLNEDGTIIITPVRNTKILDPHLRSRLEQLGVQLSPLIGYPKKGRKPKRTGSTTQP